MRKLTSDERDCLERLEAWDDKIKRLMDMYDPRGVLPQRDLAEARELYTALKRGLEAEFRSCDSSRRHPPLTDAEQRWYALTVHKAFCHLRARTNAVPKKWFDSLYEAQMDISHTIFKMKAVEGRDC